MTARWLLMPMLLLAGATAPAADLHLVHRNCTKPGCLCGVPARDYQYGSRSQSQTAISQSAILLRKRTTLVEAVVGQTMPTETGQVIVQESRREPPREPATALKSLRGRLGLDTPGLLRHLSSANGELEVVPTPQPEPDPATSVFPLPPPSFSGPQHLMRAPEMPPPPLDPLPLPQGMRWPSTDPMFWDRTASTVTVSRQPTQTVIDLYQLDRDKLQIDQCEISQVALQLHDDGQWVLSLRADQNRRQSGDVQVPYNPRLHIKRNQFVVRLRCLGNVETKPAAGVPAAGKPVLVDLDPDPFWVENGLPRYIRTAGRSVMVKDYFADIDRVEIEFFYR